MWPVLPAPDQHPRAAPAAARAAARKRAFRLRLGRRGVTAVEFAAVGPVFITLMFLVFEVAWQLTVGSALTIGLFLGSRYGITGAGGTARDANILDRIVSSSGGVLRQANLTLTWQAYQNPAVYAARGAPTAGSGSSGQLVTYTATYQQPFLTPLPSWVYQTVTGSSKSGITHVANMVVQNEPF